MSNRERAEIFDVAHGYTPLLLGELADERYLVSTSDQRIGRAMFVRGRRGERQHVGLAIQVLDDHGVGPASGRDLFVDVGANIGTTTIPAVGTFGFARGVALEPERENATLLRANLLLNGLQDRVRVLPVAGSSAPGPLTLALHPSNSGGHRVVEAPISGTVSEACEAVTLNELVERGVIQLDRLGLVWIDAQGHEPDILAGASQILESGIPLVLEYQPSALERSSAADATEALIEHYDAMVDVRLAAEPGGSRAPRALSDLPALVDELSGPKGGRRLTDLLLLRLSPR